MGKDEVYAVAQRRLRRALQVTQTTIPNQIKKEVNTPTLRWAFQILEGVEILTIKTLDGIQAIVTDLNDLKKRILSHFGAAVQKIYELENQPARAGSDP